MLKSQITLNKFCSRLGRKIHRIIWDFFYYLFLRYFLGVWKFIPLFWSRSGNPGFDLLTFEPLALTHKVLPDLLTFPRPSRENRTAAERPVLLTHHELLDADGEGCGVEQDLPVLGQKADDVLDENHEVLREQLVCLRKRRRRKVNAALQSERQQHRRAVVMVTSSITIIWTRSTFATPFFIKSRMRPGVAMTTCTASRNTIKSLFILLNFFFLKSKVRNDRIYFQKVAFILIVFSVSFRVRLRQFSQNKRKKGQKFTRENLLKL